MCANLVRRKPAHECPLMKGDQSRYGQESGVALPAAPFQYWTNLLGDYYGLARNGLAHLWGKTRRCGLPRRVGPTSQPRRRRAPVGHFFLPAGTLIRGPPGPSLVPARANFAPKIYTVSGTTNGAR